MSYTLNRNNEVNIICYQINFNDIILGKMRNGDFVVQTAEGIMIYTKAEMLEIFGVDTENSNFERLTWMA